MYWAQRKWGFSVNEGRESSREEEEDGANTAQEMATHDNWELSDTLRFPGVVFT